MFRNVSSLAIVACIAAAGLFSTEPAQAGPYPVQVLQKMLKMAQIELAQVEARIVEVKAEIAKIESSSTDDDEADKDADRLADLRHELKKLTETAEYLRGHIAALKREIAAATRPNKGPDSVGTSTIKK